VPQLATQQISKQVAGKSKDEAQSYINGITGVVSASIVISPSFLSIMPFRPEQIHFIIQPGPSTGSPNG
jgi:hypothetical protein